MQTKNRQLKYYPQRIGGIQNYYGGVMVKMENDGRTFWVLEGETEQMDWEEIPPSLFHQLITHDDQRGVSESKWAMRKKIGYGRLSWDSHERSTGRWGSISLLKNTNSKPRLHAEFNRWIGRRGYLVAEIYRMDDTMPTNPISVGTRITLGHGKMFAPKYRTIPKIGINPTDKPNDASGYDWMYWRNLEKCSLQTVIVWFVPDAGEQPNTTEPPKKTGGKIKPVKGFDYKWEVNGHDSFISNDGA